MLAYVLGFMVPLLTLGWRPHAPHKAAAAPASQTMEAAAP